MWSGILWMNSLTIWYLFWECQSESPTKIAGVVSETKQADEYLWCAKMKREPER